MLTVWIGVWSWRRLSLELLCLQLCGRCDCLDCGLFVAACRFDL